ncbi:MAG: flagellar hook-associated protein FlgL [Bacillota bacterium]
MRITHNMIGAHLINAIQLNLEGLVRGQERMSTGKKVNRPSDDPSGTSQIMSVMTDLDCTRQYLRNVDDGLSWLNQADAAMGNATSLLQQARRIAVQGSNGTLTGDDMALLAQQVDDLIWGLVDVGNTSVGGKFIFARNQLNDPPFKRNGDAIEFEGSTSPPPLPGPPWGTVERAVYYGSTAMVNVDGVYLFLTSPGGGMPNIFNALFDLRDALRIGDLNGVDAAIGKLDGSLDWLMESRVTIGARTNRLENLQSQMRDNEVRMTGVLSNLQDSDIARATIEFQQKQLSYQAALSAGARMLQTSLLDYLR